VLLDWKTVGAADFRQGDELYKIEKYFAQLSSYAAVEGIQKAVVILVNRDTGQMKELELVLDPAYGRQLIQRAEETMRFVADREVPKADKLRSNVCRFCKFQRQCSEEEDTGYIQAQLDAGISPERL
jgi:CRISPR/Cas system-associated exonuclease Cas4 (RecB family)